MKYLYCIIFSLFVLNAGAQDFSVTSISPENNTTGVHTTATITIAFSDTLSANYMDSDILEDVIIFPIDSVQYTNLSVTENENGSILEISATLTDNTDFSIVIMGVENDNGELLDRFYIQQFTTADAYTGNTVSGTSEITVYTPFKKVSADTKVKSINSVNLKWFKTDKKGNVRPELANEQDLDYTKSVVFLTPVMPNVFDDNSTDTEEEPPVEEEEGDGPPAGIFSVTSFDEFGDFEFNHIKNGDYYLAAYVFDYIWNDESGTMDFEPVAVGFYDPNGRYTPAQFTVNDEAITDLVISLYALDFNFDSSSTFFEDFATTYATIQENFGNNFKILIAFGSDSAYEVDEEEVAKRINQASDIMYPSGKSSLWTYGFYSPDSDKVYLGISSFLGLFYFEAEFDSTDSISPAEMEGITPSMTIDSDDAIALALESGASDFIDELPFDAYIYVGYVLAADVEPLLDDEDFDFEELPFQINGSTWGITITAEYYDEMKMEYQYVTYYSAIDATDGSVLYSDEIIYTSNEAEQFAQSFSLNQNYPNPFNPTTTISFNLPTATQASINIFNALGQKVAEIGNQLYNQGTHQLQFDASNLSSGTYFYRIEAGSFTATKSMTLIK
ncbi:T9SS type A sorting domain-containing protein [bacterium]|nr:MAG: T9SS type A sorting domain-containing protein [bacterium]